MPAKSSSENDSSLVIWELRLAQQCLKFDQNLCARMHVVLACPKTYIIRTYMHACMHTYMHTDKQTDRQTDRQTYGRQADRQTDKQTHVHTCIHTYIRVHIHIMGSEGLVSEDGGWACPDIVPQRRPRRRVWPVDPCSQHKPLGLPLKGSIGAPSKGSIRV